MKKILLTLAGLTAMTTAFASTPAVFPISCANNVSITATSTLQNVQQCLITKQEKSSGMVKVKFKDNNKHSYTCYFATANATEVINHCES